MTGFLSVVKPPGMTSHDVVGWLRWLTREKVGHTGTLDPLAAGVLVLTLGAATRLSEHLSNADKAYRAEVLLGLETDSYDLEGAVTAQRGAAGVTEAAVRECLQSLTGQVEMLPPMYSAVKQDGRKLYDLARAGREVERPARQVTVSLFELLSFEPGEQARAVCHVECSKGTYVRSLAQMLGERLGCGGCLGFLLRTRQGAFALDEAATLEEVAQRVAEERLEEALTPALAGLPAEVARATVGGAEAEAIRHGNPVPLEACVFGGEAPGGEQAVAVAQGEELLCVGRIREQQGRLWLQPTRVLCG